MKPIGYCNKVYGDESTELIGVFELNDDEQVIHALVAQSEKTRRPLMARSRSELKPTEIGKLAEMEAVIDELQRQCRHRVFNDKPGFLYAIRSCVICGAHMGTV